MEAMNVDGIEEVIDDATMVASFEILSLVKALKNLQKYIQKTIDEQIPIYLKDCDYDMYHREHHADNILFDCGYHGKECLPYHDLLLVLHNGKPRVIAKEAYVELRKEYKRLISDIDDMSMQKLYENVFVIKEVDNMDEKKLIKLKFPNESVWVMDASIVADDRAVYYAQKELKTRNVTEYDNNLSKKEFFDKLYEQEYEQTMLDDDELVDWLMNSMSFAEIQPHLKRMDSGSYDYEDAFREAECSVIRNIEKTLD